MSDYYAAIHYLSASVPEKGTGGSRTVRIPVYALADARATPLTMSTPAGIGSVPLGRGTRIFTRYGSELGAESRRVANIDTLPGLMETWGDNCWGIDWSPSSPELLYSLDATGRSRLIVYHTTTWEEIARHEDYFGRSFLWPTYSPDDTLVCYAAGNEYIVFLGRDAQGSLMLSPWHSSLRAGGAVRDIAWTPDSSRIMWCADEECHLYELNGTGPHVHIATLKDAEESTLRAVAASPDGAMIAYGGDAGLVHIVDATSLAEVEILTLPTDDPRPVQAVAWSHDSSYLAVGLQIYDTSDWSVLYDDLGRLRAYRGGILEWHPSTDLWLCLKNTSLSTDYHVQERTVADGYPDNHWLASRLWDATYSPTGRYVAIATSVTHYWGTPGLQVYDRQPL